MKGARRLRRQAREALEYYDRQMSDLCDDPMTHAMGAPIDDFAESYERKARRLQADVLDEMREANVCRRMQMTLCDALCAHI